MKLRNSVTPIHTHHGNCSPIVLEPTTDWSAMGKSEHFVQFYDDDHFLISSLGAFIGTGLRQGEAGIVIATKSHREALEAQLRQDGLEPEEARIQGHYYPL